MTVSSAEPAKPGKQILRFWQRHAAAHNGASSDICSAGLRHAARGQFIIESISDMWYDKVEQKSEV